jgi:hypothetical protein
MNMRKLFVEPYRLLYEVTPSRSSDLGVPPWSACPDALADRGLTAVTLTTRCSGPGLAVLAPTADRERSVA